MHINIKAPIVTGTWYDLYVLFNFSKSIDLKFYASGDDKGLFTELNLGVYTVAVELDWVSKHVTVISSFWLKFWCKVKRFFGVTAFFLYFVFGDNSVSICKKLFSLKWIGENWEVSLASLILVGVSIVSSLYVSGIVNFSTDLFKELSRRPF